MLPRNFKNFEARIFLCVHSLMYVTELLQFFTLDSFKCYMVNLHDIVPKLLQVIYLTNRYNITWGPSPSEVRRVKVSRKFIT